MLTSLLSSSAIKTALITLAATLGIGLCVTAGIVVNHQINERVTAAHNVAVAKDALAVSEGSNKVLMKQTEDLKARLEKAEELNRQTQAAYDANMGQLRELKAKFAKHDLTRLTNAHPKMVLDAINRGTARAWSMLQQSGRPSSNHGDGGKASTDRSPAPGSAARPASAAP